MIDTKCRLMASLLLGCVGHLPSHAQLQQTGRLTEAPLPRIVSQTAPSHPFSVAGPHGALLGFQDGTFEAWIYPWKLLDHMRISGTLEGYGGFPLNVNQLASSIDVQPDKTTITYSHASFTIRQTMLASQTSSDTPVLVTYEIESVRPLTLTFSFVPLMQPMWPAPNDGSPAAEWIPQADGNGFYLLHLNFPDHAGAIALTGALPGTVPPYQEHAGVWPLQFVLHFDPQKDKDKQFQLLMSVGESKEQSTKSALAQRLALLRASCSQIGPANRRYYEDFLNTHASIETPDSRLNQAFQFAITSIDQLRVEVGSGPPQTALIAGLLSSGDTTRPGFGWFFGRDALWSLYAVDSYGDFKTARSELQFLSSHQRADGKILHERSQSADLVSWDSLPYQWASADATPLFLMAAADYWKISGDTEFVRRLWPNLQRAWTFEVSHADNRDGIYENSEGTGWVESWPVIMPHQEIYLAALDVQASSAFSELASATDHARLGMQAQSRADALRSTIEAEYYTPALDSYAFSVGPDVQRDNTATIFPSVAYWDGSFSLAHAEPMFSHWASSEFSTDWGTRLLSDRTPFYDPISYHQGSVWPLFTGWVAMAEYRTGRSLSGYQHLFQNANLTWVQDLGATTELLSGEFYQVLNRSSARQLWSSAMVLSPILRGLFGLEWNAQARTLTVTPNLPADWDHAELHNVPFGSGRVDLTFTRCSAGLLVAVRGGPEGLKLASHTRGATSRGRELTIPLPSVEVGLPEQRLPSFGSTTGQMKVLRQSSGDHRILLLLSAPGGSTETVIVRHNAPVHVKAEGAILSSPESSLDKFIVTFPQASGYVEKQVSLTW